MNIHSAGSTKYDTLFLSPAPIPFRFFPQLSDCNIDHPIAVIFIDMQARRIQILIMNSYKFIIYELHYYFIIIINFTS